MSRYQYSPLRDEATDRRLLTILPSPNVSGDNHILINNISLVPGSSIDYEALSYTWGPEENPVNVFVGAEDVHIFHVTQNVASALEYLRDKSKGRVFWIDAICIDQQNLQERSSQVHRMADVYRKATRATVWLGPGNEQSRIAFEIMNYMSSMIEIDWVRESMTPSQKALELGEEEWAETSIPLPCSTEQLETMFSVLNRSWFERVWI